MDRQSMESGPSRTLDAEHPKNITMLRALLPSDMCIHIKMNNLLYTCSLDSFLDGILLNNLSCMYRFDRSFTDDEECKHKGTTTPSAKEAWRRRRKMELRRYNLMKRTV